MFSSIRIICNNNIRKFSVYQTYNIEILHSKVKNLQNQFELLSKNNQELKIELDNIKLQLTKKKCNKCTKCKK